MKKIKLSLIVRTARVCQYTNIKNRKTLFGLNFYLSEI